MVTTPSSHLVLMQASLVEELQTLIARRLQKGFAQAQKVLGAELVRENSCIKEFE